MPQQVSYPTHRSTLDEFKALINDPEFQATMFGEVANGGDPEMKAVASTAFNLFRRKGKDNVLDSMEAHTLPWEQKPQPYQDAMMRPFTKGNQEAFDRLQNQFSGISQDPSSRDPYNQYRAYPGHGRIKIGNQYFEVADTRFESANGAEEQRLLRDAGFDPGDIDGIFGKRSREALRAFQKSRGLVEDGIMGKESRKALYGQ